MKRAKSFDAATPTKGELMRTSFATKGLASAAPNWKPHERRDEIQKLQVEKDLNCIHFRRISDHDNDTFMFHPSLSVRSFKLLTLNSIFWCPGRELNPHSRCRKADFKSVASADFATRAR